MGWAIGLWDIDTCIISPYGQLSKDLIDRTNITCQTYLILVVKDSNAQR